MRRCMLLGVAAVMALILGAAAAAPAKTVQGRWVITDLRGVPGLAFSEAVAINERGQVIGNSYPCRTSFECASARAFLWENGRLTRLGTLGGKWTEARDLNDRGQVVGYSTTTGGSDHAFLWQNGVLTDLGTLPGRRESMATDVNERGQVVGVSYTEDEGCGSVYEAVCDEHACLWQNGKMVDLGTLQARSGAPGGSDPSPTIHSINAGGQIIGQGRTASGGALHAILWQNRVPIDLAEVGELKGQSDTSASNDRGQIVGFSYGKTDGRGDPTDALPFVWQDGTLTVLGALPGGKNTRAVAINERDQIVGSSTTGAGRRNAVLWTLKPDS